LHNCIMLASITLVGCRVEKNPLKNNATVVFRRNIFLGKTEKKLFELILLHRAISPISKLHINIFLCLLWQSIECKEMYPIFVFAKCCWSVHF